MITNGKQKGPPRRPDERLSNLIYKGGKSQSYRGVAAERKDVPAPETPTDTETADGHR